MDQQPGLIVSVSEIQSFKRCPRQWDLTSWSRQRLEKPEAPGVWFVTGDLVHKGIDAAITGNNWQEYITAVAKAQWEDIASGTREYTGTDPPEMTFIEFKEAVLLARQMLEHYFAYYGNALWGEYELVSSEMSMLVPIPGTNGFLTGTLDRLLLHRPTWTLWISDTKTYSQKPDPVYLSVDDQMGKYCWMVS